MKDIKNGDMPVNALTGYAYENFESAVNKSGSYNPECQGLTKREHFAGLAMQGILSHSFGRVNPEGCAMASMQFADALLKELEK